MNNFPPAIEFKANLNEGINSIGGTLVITPETLIFKAHSINFGNLSDRVFPIKDIVGFKKGLLTFLYINFANGQRIKLTLWNKQKVIDEIEARKKYL
jgi:hypothetical protein